MSKIMEEMEKLYPVPTLEYLNSQDDVEVKARIRDRWQHSDILRTGFMAAVNYLKKNPQ